MKDREIFLYLFYKLSKIFVKYYPGTIKSGKIVYKLLRDNTTLSKKRGQNNGDGTKFNHRLWKGR